MGQALLSRNQQTNDGHTHTHTISCCVHLATCLLVVFSNVSERSMHKTFQSLWDILGTYELHRGELGNMICANPDGKGKFRLRREAGPNKVLRPTCPSCSTCSSCPRRASGASGASKASKASGASGASGAGGASAASGASEASGASGASGASWASGASRASEASGASGLRGASGASATSETSGAGQVGQVGQVGPVGYRPHSRRTKNHIL